MTGSSTEPELALFVKPVLHVAEITARYANVEQARARKNSPVGAARRFLPRSTLSPARQSLAARGKKPPHLPESTSPAEDRQRSLGFDRFIAHRLPA